jgi:pyruvate dehydrogenase E2 component (dihydrolipoamide acetyltransferase)
MAIEVTIPRLGWNMDEGIFVGWLKREGERIVAGEPLFTLEGDKATQEIESLETGILRIPPGAPKEGEKVAVGTLIGYLVATDEVARFEVGIVGRSSPSSSLAAERSKPRISPRARRALRELAVDAAALRGTGRNGRVLERDVLAAARLRSQPAHLAAKSQDPGAGTPAAVSPGEYRALPVSSVRAQIADRMLQSARTTAAVTITTTIDATNLVNLRRQFKAVAQASEGPAIGITDIVVKLTALALAKHPLLNARWEENEILLPSSIHIGFAVDTEAGLLVPVIRDVPRLTLRQLAAVLHELVERARQGALLATELRGSTFTVTNLGPLGVETFTPLINPPECAVLGLGRIARQVVVEENQFVARDRLFLSLTFDHRIVDGAPAARFLQSLGRFIENPSPWLLP